MACVASCKICAFPANMWHSWSCVHISRAPCGAPWVRDWNGHRRTLVFMCWPDAHSMKNAVACNYLQVFLLIRWIYVLNINFINWLERVFFSVFNPFIVFFLLRIFDFFTAYYVSNIRDEKLKLVFHVFYLTLLQSVWLRCVFLSLRNFRIFQSNVSKLETQKLWNYFETYTMILWFLISSLL